MKFYIPYNTLKDYCKQYKAMDVLSAVAVHTTSPKDLRFRGMLNLLYLIDSNDVNYSVENAVEAIYMKEHPDDARLFLPTGRTPLKTVSLDFLYADEYLSDKDINILKEKQSDIKDLLVLRKLFMEEGISIKLPKGFPYVQSGNDVEPFYLKKYGISPLSSAKLIALDNPLDEFKNSILFLKGKVAAYDNHEMELLFCKCREEGLVLNIVSDAVSPGDSDNQFYYEPMSHLYR